MPEIDVLIRSTRRSIALKVLPDGRLEVRAPQLLARAEIEAFVARHSAWIEHTRQRIEREAHRMFTLRFAEGEELPFLGRRYPLRLIETQRPPLSLQDGVFIISRQGIPGASLLFVRWYQQQAKKLLPARLEKLADRHQLVYHSFRLTGARYRVGSCSRKGIIRLSWRLILLPPKVIDYVICHELAHLRYFDHSAFFWNEVERMCPDYRRLRRVLHHSYPLLDW